MKFSALAACALIGVAVLDCSKSSSLSGSGALKIAFAIPDGSTISSVHYAMTLNGAAGPSGSFNTSDTNSSPSFDIALQPSTNDTITLTATTSTGVSCTTGASPAFSIMSNAPTIVNLTLVCGTGSPTSVTGTVDVRANVTTSDNCPNITQVVVAPYQTSVGATISLSAVASDLDAADVVTYAWTATGGTLATPTGANDTYTCGTAGAQTITVAVNDNPVGGGCTASINLPVNCVAVAGTGGTTGTGGGVAGTTGTGGGVAGTTGTGGGVAGTTGTGGGAGTAGTGGGAGTAGAAGAPATGGTTGTGGAAGAMVVSCGAPANGIWPDISGNGHDATLKNFSVGSGPVGDGTPANAYAVNFDGVDDFAELALGADGLRLTSEASLEIWVNNNFAEGVGSYNNMYSNRNGTADYSGFFGSIINPGDINSSQWYAGATSDGANWVLPFPVAPGRPPSNTWTHYLATFSLSQGVYSLYINGVLAASTPLTAPIVYSAAAVPRVGGEATGSYFRGKFGEIRIWAAALDSSEVQARYQTGAPTYGIVAPSPTVTVTKPLALRLVATPCP